MNGQAERYFDAGMGMKRALLEASNTNHNIWALGVCHATYLKICLLSVEWVGQSPRIYVHGYPVPLSSVQVFGFLVSVGIPPEERKGKLSDKPCYAGLLGMLKADYLFVSWMYSLISSSGVGGSMYISAYILLQLVRLLCHLWL